MTVSVLVAAGSAYFAYYCYILAPEVPQKIAVKMQGVYNLVFNKYKVDEFYFARIINPIVASAKGLWEYVDVSFIDKTTYVIADFVQDAAKGLRQLQNGNVQRYALYILIGLFTTLSYVVLR